MVKTILSEIVYFHLLCENVSTAAQLHYQGCTGFINLIQKDTCLVKNIERYEL